MHNVTKGAVAKETKIGNWIRIPTELAGVVVLQPTTFEDARGFFFESYNRRNFTELGILHEFVQDNHSQSVRGTLRGLHYQLRHPQAKLCRVVAGEALDVAVDIRVGSPTFGRSISAVLSAQNKKQIYIAPGFAHGFVALSSRTDFLYKCSDFYYPDDEYGVLWKDPALNIDWRIDSPLLSEKDAKLLPLKEIASEYLPKYTLGDIV
jgi:dTDP-4-dehydrorhamnose 3,5-epimerase